MTTDPVKPDLTDELWTNAHLRRYFGCGATKLVDIKKDPAFPRAALISGLQRYDASQVREYIKRSLIESFSGPGKKARVQKCTLIQPTADTNPATTKGENHA